jgi:hypothetical protein
MNYLSLTGLSKKDDVTNSSFASLILLQAVAEPSYFVAEEPDDDNILRTRTYDVSIT